MKYFTTILLSLVCLLPACKDSTNPEVAFYHWKSKALFTPVIDGALQQTKTADIYMHYFDVDVVREADYFDNGLYPVYVLQEVDDAFKNYNIIPVVFITNATLKRELDIADLGERIRKLIDEISLHHFGERHKTIQLDCDWSESTRERFFALVALLQEVYTVSVTIRLHQVKYKERTGVPPVDEAVLMLYNVGDLKNFEVNSVLQKDIVDAYLDAATTYPLKLDVALPLFAQTVLKNNADEYRLLAVADRNLLEQDTFHFDQKSENVFVVKRDTLYKGFYLSQDYELKLEMITLPEIVAAYDVVQQSRLDIGKLIFYHLDDAALLRLPPGKILEEL